jgi:hypothetical protein
VTLEYREREVHVSGRVAPGLAGELSDAAAKWRASFADEAPDTVASGVDGTVDVPAAR